MGGYRDLEIYKLAHELGVEIHKMSLGLPKFEMYEEGSQIRRAAKSVASNIVEGFGRRKYKADYSKFLIYAHASCDETKEHLKLLYETKSLKDKNVYFGLLDRCEVLSKMMNRFIRVINK